jgi:hypothetical protein
MKKQKLIKFYNIEYDFDDTDIVDDLPTEITAATLDYENESENDLSEFIDETGADWISEQVGFCVLGFNYEISNLYVFDKNW